MMTFYWLYDLPNWLFCVTVVAAFIAFGVVGLYVTRRWVRRLHRIDHSHNDIVGYFSASVFVLYGITLGLVAVGTWTTFSDVQNKVDAEAEVTAAIFRDVGTYPEPYKSEMQQDMRTYVRYVIDKSWPQMREGIVPQGSDVYLQSFLDHLMSFQPKTMADQINQTEVFKQYNVLVEARRARLNAVTTGLPGPIWSLVIIGGLICVVVTLFFDTQSFAMHLWMTILLSALLGLIIFQIGTLDNPFRGQVSITPEPLTAVYDQLLSK